MCQFSASNNKSSKVTTICMIMNAYNMHTTTMKHNRKHNRKQMAPVSFFLFRFKGKIAYLFFQEGNVGCVSAWRCCVWSGSRSEGFPCVYQCMRWWTYLAVGYKSSKSSRWEFLFVNHLQIHPLEGFCLAGLTLTPRVCNIFRCGFE